MSALGEDDVLAGKYRLLHPLSQGGMGTLWLAHDDALDIDCAVKLIRADLAEVEREYCGGRLLQEARAAAKLGHPAIVRVTDAGRTAGGHPYLVMELLSGEDMGAVITRHGRVDAERAVQTLLPIVHALSAAHALGIVHRDVKPENIFLARNQDGSIQPKLIDFGIAKFRGAHATRLTRIGTIVGTPGYMAPEQARGCESDARADIFALCVILYELITGEQPFCGDNYHALIRAIIENEAATLTSFDIHDAVLAGILERGMAKAPHDRWPTMHDLGFALAEWLVTHGTEEDICGTSLRAQWLDARPSYDSGDPFDSQAERPERTSTPPDVAGERALKRPPPLPRPDPECRAPITAPREPRTRMVPTALNVAPPLVGAPDSHQHSRRWALLLGAATLLAAGAWVATLAKDAPGASQSLAARASALAPAAPKALDPDVAAPLRRESDEVAAAAAAASVAMTNAASPEILVSGPASAQAAPAMLAPSRARPPEQRRLRPPPF